jgi:hypothetical protein
MEENREIGGAAGLNQDSEPVMPPARLNGENPPEYTAEPVSEQKWEPEKKPGPASPMPSESRAKNTEPIGFWGFLLMLVILAIPVVNLIALIRWSFSKDVNVNKKNLSRVILLLGILAFAFYLAAPRLVQSMSASAQEPSAWAEEEINRALEVGILDEEDAAYYVQEITREEMVELAVRVYETSVDATAKQMEPNPFSDTQNPAILKAAQLNIISSSGAGATEFRPMGPVDRQTMAVILLSTAKSARPDIAWDTAVKADFSDASEIDGWAVEAMHFAFNQNIYAAHENNILPHLLITREEAIVCAERLYELSV